MNNRLASGEDVMISGFGKWNVTSNHAWRGRSPQTEQELVLDARRIVTGKCSLRMRGAVKEPGKREKNHLTRGRS
jgi:integration host factor subunit alpha